MRDRFYVRRQLVPSRLVCGALAGYVASLSTATTWCPAPIATSMSVAVGDSEMMRLGAVALRRHRCAGESGPGDRARPDERCHRARDDEAEQEPPPTQPARAHGRRRAVPVQRGRRTTCSPADLCAAHAASSPAERAAISGRRARRRAGARQTSSRSEPRGPVTLRERRHHSPGAGLLAPGSSLPPAFPGQIPQWLRNGFAPRSQWRDRAGFSPASLFGPQVGTCGQPRARCSPPLCSGPAVGAIVAI